MAPNQMALNGTESTLSSFNVIDESFETSTNSRQSRTRRSSRLLVLLRMFVLDLPLTALFALLLVTCAFRELHEDYFVPFLDAAERSDDDLSDEFTYYDRVCAVEDITTRNLSDLVVSQHVSAATAVDIVRKHGAAVLPQLLSNETVATLRAYIVRRSESLPEDEMLPVSQGENRISFTLDATEDPIIAVALEEIASNPKFRSLMEGLLGPNPALSEISPINAYFGCPDQAWHADVKPDGSPFKYARTYVQSYTAFIALQDTTGEMGATELLPGSHYCGESGGMQDLCEKYGMQINEASADGVWHRGDGAIVSQQAWHRGAAHKDANASERITFTVTFLPRPNLTHHRRQLSRGTYFHMKWNMWGHTFMDMLDAHVSMAQPFSILRCLGVWKPANREYGFDFITSSALRMANNEDGACVDDLPIFVNEFVSKLGIPKFLQGPVTQHRFAWTMYLNGTLGKCYDFLSKIHSVAIAIYVLLAVLFAVTRRDHRVITKTTLRMTVLYGGLLLVWYLIMKGVKETTFASDIAAGRMLWPFPSPVDELVVDGSVTEGHTTFPERLDVLVGSRYDARFLFGFDHFLDYHPGNEAFRARLTSLAPYYKSYLGLPIVFADGLLESIVSSTMAQGRFLQQDFRSGDWRLMSSAEGREHTRMSLLAGGTRVLGEIQQEIAYLLADYRFGLHRETRLADESQRYLYHVKLNLLQSQSFIVERPISAISSMPSARLHSLLRAIRAQSDTTKLEPRSSGNARWINIPEPESHLVVGKVVFARSNEHDRWWRGTIARIRQWGQEQGVSHDVEFSDGTRYLALNAANIRPYSALVEGSRVLVDWQENGECYPATVLHVRPSREIDVQFDDGDYEEFIPYWTYFPLLI